MTKNGLKKAKMADVEYRLRVLALCIFACKTYFSTLFVRFRCLDERARPFAFGRPKIRLVSIARYEKIEGKIHVESREN